MKQRFLNFVWNHPSDLVSVNSLWLQRNDVTGEYEPVFPDIPTDASAAEVEQRTKDFQEKMKALAEADPEKYKHGKDTVNIPYRMLPQHKKEHQVLVKLRGKTYVLTVNGNPRLAQALNGMTNPDMKAEGFWSETAEIVRDVNRKLSSLYTTYNPDFVAGNFMRDMMYANTMVWIKEKPAYARAFHRNIGKLAVHDGKPVAMLTLFHKYENGTLDMNDYTERMFSLFMNQ